MAIWRIPIPLLFVIVVLPCGLQACNPSPNTNHNATSASPISAGSPSFASNSTSAGALIANQEVALNPVNNNISPPKGMSSCGTQSPNCGATPSDQEDVPSYQHVIVSGLPFQRGESHGRQAKEKILTLISHYKSSRGMPAWEECIAFVNAHYFQALKYYYPNGLEEMKGIAHGANVSLEDILILNARYDLSRWKRSEIIGSRKPGRKGISSSELAECSNNQRAAPQSLGGDIDNISYQNEIDSQQQECTGAVALSSATKYGHVLLGQNWDTSEIIFKNDTAILLEVHPDPCERIKPFVMLTEAGQLGRSGMNADGMGIVAMSLWSSADKYNRTDSETDIGWVPATLLRRMFLEAPNFSVGLRTLLQTPRHVSVNMIIATAEDEALNIELTPDEYFVTQVPLEKEFLTHSNHFKSAAFAARENVAEGSRGSSSLFRDRRVERHLMNDWPRINESTFQSAFKDHVGWPNSVCEHIVPKDQSYLTAIPGEITAASIIFNLSQRTLQLCKGPPCVGTFKDFRFKFSQI